MKQGHKYITSNLPLGVATHNLPQAQGRWKAYRTYSSLSVVHSLLCRTKIMTITSRMQLWLHTVSLSFLKCLNPSACDRLCHFLQFDSSASPLEVIFIYGHLFSKSLLTWHVGVLRTLFVWKENRKYFHHFTTSGLTPEPLPAWFCRWRFVEGNDKWVERICIFLSDSSPHVYRH